MKTAFRIAIFLSLSSITLFVTSCTDQDCCVYPNIDVLDHCGEPLVPFDLSQYESLPTDSASVKAVVFDQACMIVDFAYSGCDEHDIEAMAYIDDTDILRVKLIHNNLDACLAFFQHRDTFNLYTVPNIDQYTDITVDVFQFGTFTEVTVQ